MATAAIAARNGLLAYSTGTAATADAIAELRNIRLRLHRDVIDATSNDSSGWTDAIAGTASWSATAEYLYIHTTSASQYKIHNALSSGTTGTVMFVFSTATGSSGWQLSGNVFVTDFEAGGETNGAHMVNVTFTGYGSPTWSTSIT